MALVDAWKEGKQQRQQEIAHRQQAIQQILSEFGKARQQTATQLHHHLTVFRAGLIQQEQQRRTNYCVLAAELQLFRDELQSSVRSLRDTMQIDIAACKASTQDFLATCQEQRSHIKAETQAELIAFIEALRSEVQSYLVELEILRQGRAEQVQQDLQQSRAAREVEVQALFERFTEFRSELQNFRRSLSETVWGVPAPTTPTAPQSQPLPLVVPKPISSKPTPSQPAPSKPGMAKLSAKSPFPKNSLSGKTTSPKNTPKATAKPSTAAKTFPVTKVSVSQPATPTIESKSTDVAFEKEVYTFLHQNQGARLTQIETSLKINRFQAVDALRSLIKKGLITQRDRIYLTQAAVQS
uniref:Gas vesicle protein GvpC n=1 Tax=Oscillatoriales cyanobacterium SpSt-402 TaxID=2282168 RepID=A0A832M2F1_9CYAN